MELIFTCIFFAISIILLCISLFIYTKDKQVKILKNLQQENYQNQLENKIHQLEIAKNNLIHSQIQKKEQLHQEYIQYQKFLNQQREDANQKLIEQQHNRKKEIQDYIKTEKQLAKQTIDMTYKSAQQQIMEINDNIQLVRNNAIQQKENIQNEINKLKASLSAGVEARLREQKIKQQMNFYKLSISEADLSDVKMLENLKVSFHKPVVLSKLIWSQYFQKQMTDLCDRILGKKNVCGIYKITNILTEQCYIGQSVNISDRWKQHCKCGLGIQASATNILYNAMQKDGVWNFTFELLEECPKELLNEKERFWIEMYQSNTFGYNTMKGNMT